MFRRVSVCFMFDMTEIISTEFIYFFNYGLQFDGQIFFLCLLDSTLLYTG